MQQYFRDNALFWLDKYRLDGLRFDAVTNIRNRNGNNDDPMNDLPDGWRLLQWINNEIHASQPWKIIIAEDLKNSEWITKNTGEGGAGFSSQWDAGFVHPIRSAIISADDANRDMLAIRDALYHRYNDNAMQRVIYTESHDEVANGQSRVPEEIWPGNACSWFSRKRSTLGAAIVFTTPGIPMIFQGFVVVVRQKTVESRLEQAFAHGIRSNLGSTNHHILQYRIEKVRLAVASQCCQRIHQSDQAVCLTHVINKATFLQPWV